MNSQSRYASHRVYLVPADLHELAGPSTGVVELPLHLDWSEQRVYDLKDDGQLGLMYERVIREAVQLDDLRTYLNGSVLVRIWPRLYLPVQARQVWEARFRNLVRASIPRSAPPWMRTEKLECRLRSLRRIPASPACSSPMGAVAR
ncbi:hypothetical protein AB0F17_40950 [Nonomuraea sp. NPDC026600]|uniref:hypothetical protein n=1 Tax=Nonomuraea sp. NPDC026600 TaxID=3155363 RepID=UPI0033E3F3CB